MVEERTLKTKLVKVDAGELPKQNKLSRLVSLDVFRGITIAMMILVNSPGNQTAYSLLEHAEWNGFTLADLVFPFFLFIVGVSLVFSLSKEMQQGTPLPELQIKILKRACIIFALGLLLSVLPPHYGSVTFRVFGVLQRIAVCYFIVSLLFLTTRLRTQVILMFVLVIGYWLIMTLIPVPGYGANNLTQEGNLAAYIDRLIFSSQHLYGKVFDPEGLLSTLPAIATVLLGTITGVWLRSKHTNAKKITAMILIGVLALGLAWFWSLWFPINKALWTSSFVLLTGGLALIILALCYWLIEVKNWRWWSKPFEIFGLNAIAAYFLHIFFLKVQALISMPRLDGSPGNLRLFITDHVFGNVYSQQASLMYAISYVICFLLLFSFMYRKKIFIKI